MTATEFADGRWPATIRVGYRTYPVEIMSAMESTGKDVFGECDNAMGVIRVRGDMEPVKTANTMLHELLHACWYVAAVSDEDKQERTVNILANMLTQVWRDNPEFVAFLNQRLTAA